MNSKDYIKAALNTEADVHKGAMERIKDNEKLIRLLHTAMGLATEAGEFLDQLKKHIFYGKPLDEINLKEEIGDAFWYIAIGLDVMGEKDFGQVMKTNIEKLVKRYPEKFKEWDALNRDLSKERKVLEEGKK